MHKTQSCPSKTAAQNLSLVRLGRVIMAKLDVHHYAVLNLAMPDVLT
jgi:hypothetical protein